MVCQSQSLITRAPVKTASRAGRQAVRRTGSRRAMAHLHVVPLRCRRALPLLGAAARNRHGSSTLPRRSRWWRFPRGHRAQHLDGETDSSTLDSGAGVVAREGQASPAHWDAMQPCLRRAARPCHQSPLRSVRCIEMQFTGDFSAQKARSLGRVEGARDFGHSRGGTGVVAHAVCARLLRAACCRCVLLLAACCCAARCPLDKTPPATGSANGSPKEALDSNLFFLQRSTPG